MIKYTTLLFDADQTLLDFKRSEYEAVKECMEYFNIECDSEKISKYSEINDGYWKMLERGEIEKQKLYSARWKTFAQYYGYDLDAEKMSDKYIDALSEKAYVLDGAEQMLERLSKHCKIYIITNGNKKVQNGRMSRTNLKQYIDGIFISEEIGYEKPKKEYFDIVEKKIPDFSRENSLVIGDSLTSDIQGGINAGIDTCWYNPFKKPSPQNMKISYTVNTFSEIEDIVLC